MSRIVVRQSLYRITWSDRWNGLNAGENYAEIYHEDHPPGPERTSYLCLADSLKAAISTVPDHARHVRAEFFTPGRSIVVAYNGEEVTAFLNQMLVEEGGGKK